MDDADQQTKKYHRMTKHTKKFTSKLFIVAQFSSILGAIAEASTPFLLLFAAFYRKREREKKNGRLHLNNNNMATTKANEEKRILFTFVYELDFLILFS